MEGIGTPEEAVELTYYEFCQQVYKLEGAYANTILSSKSEEIKEEANNLMEMYPKHLQQFRLEVARNAREPDFDGVFESAPVHDLEKM